MVSYLQDNRTLKVLDVSRNMIGDVRPLASALMVTDKPEGEQKKRAEENVEESLISSKCGLTSIDLSSNYILSEGLVALAEMLQVNTTLCHLNLSNNLIARTRTPPPPSSSSSPSSLSSLSTSSSSPSSSSSSSSFLLQLPHDLAGLRALSEAFGVNRTLVSCDLSRNQLWVGEASAEEEKRLMVETLQQLGQR